MALMFPRLARNFAKNGYYPTDEPTLERALAALAPSDGPMCILDPCAGEGVAIAEAAHALGREQVRAYAVEYDAERARHARQLVDRCIHSDLMDTMISRQSFGLLWLNPPYGDLSKDVNGNMGYQGQGRARLEKLFYQRTLPLLQYGGVLIFIVPSYVLDAELVGWLTRHFAELRIYRAAETQFKQVVIFGRRVRQRDQASDAVKTTRAQLLQIGQGDVEAEELPIDWPFLPYTVPACSSEPEHFYRVTMEPEQFADEVGRLQGLWPMLDTHLGAAQQSLRPPARALSHWHLALALAAGAISGVVKSKSGRVLVVKGDTHKEKALHKEYTERDDGTVTETRIVRQALPMVLSFLKMALVICIPLVLMFGVYELKTVMTMSCVEFALFFVDFWFQLARWLDSTMLDALYGWGFGADRPHTNFDPLIGLNNAYGDMLLNFVMAMMFIVLPSFWVMALSWAGIRAGNFLGGLTAATADAKAAGASGGRTAIGAAKSAANAK